MQIDSLPIRRKFPQVDDFQAWTSKVFKGRKSVEEGRANFGYKNILSISLATTTARRKKTRTSHESTAELLRGMLDDVTRAVKIVLLFLPMNLFLETTFFPSPLFSSAFVFCFVFLAQHRKKRPNIGKKGPTHALEEEAFEGIVV